MIKILHMVAIMNLGGQETLIMNVFRELDRKKYQFDFIVQRNDKGFYDDEIKRLGGNIYIIDRLTKNPIKHFYQLFKILKNNKYDVFHRHTNSSIVFLDVLVAKICNISKIVVHSHSTSSNTSNFIHKLFKPILNVFKIIRVACSSDAGKFMFGTKKFKIINNGINIEKFSYNERIRNKIRENLNIDKNEIVIGHVGRFTYEKNQEFIIEIFSDLIKDTLYNYKLLLIGDGDNIIYIRDKANNCGLDKKVVFLGNKKNVNEYLQAFDLFVFPSLYEGLGISLIEAQTSGIRCIASNHIPKESIITNNIYVLELNKLKWTKKIKELSGSKYDRKQFNINEKILNFSIKKTVDDFCLLYCKE